jgi:hypothetical protein
VIGEYKIILPVTVSALKTLKLVGAEMVCQKIIGPKQNILN